eukprot:129283-Chlamydomonas_euryale.AAC.1
MDSQEVRDVGGGRMGGVGGVEHEEGQVLASRGHDGEVQDVKALSQSGRWKGGQRLARHNAGAAWSDPVLPRSLPARPAER